MDRNKKWSRKALIFVLVAGALVLAGCGLFTRNFSEDKGTVRPLDDVTGDGDLLKPGLNPLDLGTVTVGKKAEGTLRLYLQRQGWAFQEGSTVTVEFNSVPQSAGPLVVTMLDNKITVPAGWVREPNNTIYYDDYAEAKFELTATQPGQYNFVAHFTASGTRSDGQSVTVAPINVIVRVKVVGDGGGGQETYSISGAKWHDKNRNGEWDIDEPPLAGWTIRLYSYSDGTYSETSTNDSGVYVFTNLSPGQYRVEEEVQENWLQTYPLNPLYHEVKITNADIKGLNFGNVKTYSISGVKWYDRNKNGNRDDGEPGIPGWRIELYPEDGTSVDPVFTDENGAYKFTKLFPGKYVVKEGPVSGTWIQTFPLNPNYHEVTIVDEDVTGKNFGNVCEITASGGYTLGFWSNRNGQTVLDKNPGWMTYLNRYNLRNKAGAKFTITGYTGFRSWLLSADAVNMSYMLSVQLAATLLNIQYMGTNYTGLGIIVGGEWKSIGDVISMANAFLGTYGNTPAGHVKRAGAEFYKNVFDNLNNNRLTLIPEYPCQVPNWP